MGRAIEPDDAGFWVTCQRGAENKAISEMMELCDKVKKIDWGLSWQLHLYISHFTDSAGYL
jgi:hypothetical protein